MTDRTVTTWTCDRCDLEVEKKQGEQPNQWGRVSLATPPRHAEPTRMADLCESCVRALKRFVETAPVMDRVAS